MNINKILLKAKQKILDFRISIKISIFYLILVLITIVVCLVLYNKLYVDGMSKKVQEVTIQTLYSINSNISSTMDSINNISKMIISDKDVRSKLNGKYTGIEKDNYIYGSQNYYMNNIDFFSQLKGLINEFPTISSVYIIDNKFNLYESDKNSEMSLKYKDKDKISWYNDVLEKKGGYILSLNAGGIFNNRRKENYVSLIRTIRDIEEPSDDLGTLILNISNKALTNSYMDVVKDNDMGVILFDENNKKIVSNKDLDENHVKKFIIEAEDREYYSRIKKIDKIQYVESYLWMEKYNWKLVSIIPFDELADQSDVNIIIFLIVLINVIMLFIGGIFISKIITNPIKKLINSMKGIENKKFELVDLSDRRDEIGKLKVGYNAMITEIKNLLEKTINEQKIKRKAELNVLQQQVKPHFLYNTLDALSYLALSEGNDKLYEALEALGSYYRNSLSKGREVITIIEEIQIVKSYLILQNLRYGNIVEVEYEIDDNVNDFKILKMILQPLVENAIYHGIKPKGSGKIKISINLKNNNIYVIVEDDGVGMDENEVSVLNSDKIDNNELSFGIKGTIQRLRIFYGVLGFYSIESKRRYGTKITIIIPAEGRLKID
ncbi:MAG: histidine kinase [Clostridiales bacterium]